MRRCFRARPTGLGKQLSIKTGTRNKNTILALVLHNDNKSSPRFPNTPLHISFMASGVLNIHHGQVHQYGERVSFWKVMLGAQLGCRLRLLDLVSFSRLESFSSWSGRSLGPKRVVRVCP